MQGAVRLKSILHEEVKGSTAPRKVGNRSATLRIRIFFSKKSGETVTEATYVHRAPLQPRLLLGAAAVLTIVTTVYWPTLSAGFVWDDVLNFQQRAWLYHGDEWKRYIFTGFNEWQHYFRPLGVASFVLQARLFDGQPAPMHAVSLAMQLTNALLIMLLAHRLTPVHMQMRAPLILLAGLGYGVHPMLVETVVWIGVQFDQLQVMLASTGLLFFVGIRRVWFRAALVSACFFLSACAKESAAAFPAIVLLFDLLQRSDQRQTVTRRITDLLSENWPVYIALVAAGFAYLVLRHSAMGALVHGVTPSMFVPDAPKAEEIAYVYLKYWGVILGVATNLNPLHPVDSVTFGANIWLTLARLFGALAILVFGTWAISRRLPATGTIIWAVTLYLVPVSGIFPGHFDGSLYHERYAIGAVALTAILLPRSIREWTRLLPETRTRILPKALGALAIIWVAWAIPNVRATIPLWSSDLALWSWAVKAHPENSFAVGNLISANINEKQPERARLLVQDALARNMDCSNCYINGFMLAVVHGDLSLANATLDKIRTSPDLAQDRSLALLYWRTVGFLELRLGNARTAVEALEFATSIENSEPFTRVLLTEALVADGQAQAAQEQADLAIRLAWPPERAEAKETLDRILAGERVYGLPIPTSESPDEKTG